MGDRQYDSVVLRRAQDRGRLSRTVLAAVCAISLVVATLGLAGGPHARAAAMPTLTIAQYSCQGESPLTSPESTTGVAYEPLVWGSASGRFVPGLAQSWKVAPGNESITFTLRANVRFSDGTALDAQAVKTWLDWLSATHQTGDLGSIRSVDVLGTYVIRINLANPNPYLLIPLSEEDYYADGNVTSPKAVAVIKADPKSSILNLHTYGAGPYVYDPSQSVGGDHCTFIPNTYYYDTSKIKWSKVIFKFLTDENAILAGLRTGQIDVGTGAAADVSAAEAAGLKVVQVKPLDEFLGLGFLDRSGTLNPALKDPRVRQALNYAVDRETITKALYGSLGVATSTPFPGAAGNDPAYVNYYSYNPARAKALLAAAGYKNGFTLKLFTFVPGPDTKLDALAEALKAEFAAVGVTVDLQIPTNFTQFDPLWSSKKWDAAVYLYYGASNSPVFQWANRMLPGGFWSDQHGWHDPVLDDLYHKAIRASGEAELALERQMIARCITQGDFVPVSASGPMFFFNPKRVTGVRLPTGYSDQIPDWSPAQ